MIDPKMMQQMQPANKIMPGARYISEPRTVTRTCFSDLTTDEQVTCSSSFFTTNLLDSSDANINRNQKFWQRCLKMLAKVLPTTLKSQCHHSPGFLEEETSSRFLSTTTAAMRILNHWYRRQKMKQPKFLNLMMCRCSSYPVSYTATVSAKENGVTLPLLDPQ